jgi:hypothetical protein
LEGFREGRAAFFKTVYGPVSGAACLAYIPRNKGGDYKERFFTYPSELDRMIDFVESHVDKDDVYFCPQLFGNNKRTKDDATLCMNLWADLDECNPKLLLVTPTFSIESSPGRFQAVWCLEAVVDAQTAEDLTQRIAYRHASEGADRSGWDITQMLRVPNTYNYKYEDTPLVTSQFFNKRYTLEDFSAYTDTPITRKDASRLPMPDLVEVEKQFPNGIDAFMRDKAQFMGTNVYGYYKGPVEPGSDWSKLLWAVNLACFEAGCTKEQVYAISAQAACNKWQRDGRPEKLWGDVVKAYLAYCEKTKAVVIPEFEQVDLLTDDELKRISQRPTFVERYIKWASNLGDAAVQYHQAGAFIILSAILSGRVNLPTSYGTVVPNLWFMILADTTLTRKSTAMDIAIDLLVEVDSDVIMATDGSLEGLMQSLSTRPGKSSIFLRDEFTGLLDSMTRKDYMAGMAEVLTKMYDGKMQKRLLRKETIEVKEPILIIFAGGIKSKTQQLLTLEQISSGFIPRFVFITAESDVRLLRPLGPPVVRDMREREEILEELRDLQAKYNQLRSAPERGVKLGPKDKWVARLTQGAWDRMNEFEATIMKAGSASERADILTPVYDRLSKSMLKAAILLAAAASDDPDQVVVEEIDILHAISYASGWREHAIEIINGVGKTAAERDIERVVTALEKKKGKSATRSELMQRFHLTAKSADALFNTMTQRGVLNANTQGKATLYSLPGGGEE